MMLGRRHSGTVTPLLAASFRVYQGCCAMTTTPAMSSPVIIPKNVRPATPGEKPYTPLKTIE